MVACSISGYSQIGKEYFIVTVEAKKSSDIHGVEKYRWIIPIDSLNSYNEFKIYPVYVNDFSKDKLDNCEEGKQIEIFTATTNSDFNFSDNYKNELTSLENIVSSNRKRVQRIIKKWSKGKKQISSIYITPIIGNFCFCETSNREKEYFNHDGIISLPLSDFKFDSSLWEKGKGKEVLHIDFSKYTFSNVQ